MPEAFIAGVVAGYGIAIPVGAIAILILRIGSRDGFGVGFAAGAGAATADGVYATVAAVAGAAVVASATPILPALRALAAAVLIGIGIRWLLEARRESSDAPPVGRKNSRLRTYATLLGLTLLNPLTVAYFAALAIGLPDLGRELTARAAFVTGAFLASLSWQTILALAGAMAGWMTGPRGTRVTNVIASAIVLAFAIRIVLSLM